MRGSRSNYEFAQQKHQQQEHGNGYSYQHKQTTTVLKSSQTIATMSSYGDAADGDSTAVSVHGSDNLPPPLPPKRKNGEL